MKLTIFANRMSLDVGTGTWKNDPNNKHFKTTDTIRWIDVGLKPRRARLAGFANGILTTHRTLCKGPPTSKYTTRFRNLMARGILPCYRVIGLWTVRFVSRAIPVSLIRTNCQEPAVIPFFFGDRRHQCIYMVFLYTSCMILSMHQRS